jgi:3-hydroxyacyl-CoA dehydrogenase
MASPSDHYTPEQLAAMQHVEQAEKEATRVPGIRDDIPLRPINRVAIIGAGTMGGGIAMNFANAGIPVQILELKQEALDRGMEVVRKNYERTVSKGKLSQDDMDKRMALLTGTLSYDDLAEADLVIEAVFENLNIKKQVFETLDRVCRPGAILASNTSTLDVDAIASATARPEDVIGLHFFSPANVMKLLEVVRGAKTADDVLATTLAMARTIKKVPVVSGVCFGFIGNRMLEPYNREANRLLLEGATPAQVDGVMTGTGLAMGVLSMYDLAGIDVGYLVRESRRDEFATDPGYCRISDELYHLGRYGQKTGRGFYLYDQREKKEDPEVVTIARQLSDELGIPRRDIGNDEIHDRCLYMLINEGIQILDEGIALRSSDIDLVWIYGYGFPAWLGGPMHYAEQIGLEKVLASIEHYRDTLSDYGKLWFEPATLLKRLVAEGKTSIEKI